MLPAQESPAPCVSDGYTCHDDSVSISSSDSQLGAVLSPISGDTVGCPSWGGECNCHLVGTGQDAVKHPTMHRHASTTKNYFPQIVNSAEVENLRSRVTLRYLVKMTIKSLNGIS